MTRKALASVKSRKDPKPLSDAEVARYLKHLAAAHRDKRVGNPLLADGLARVADRLLDDSYAERPVSRGDGAKSENPELPLGPEVLHYERLEAEDVKRIIQDNTRTKAEIIDLAAGRFGIPRSKLLKLSIDSVRDAVRSALMHEASLAVITEEAARYGARRQS